MKSNGEDGRRQSSESGHFIGLLMVPKQPLVNAQLKETADPVVFGDQSEGIFGKGAVPTFSLASLRSSCMLGPSDAISNPTNHQDKRALSFARVGSTTVIRIFR